MPKLIPLSTPRIRGNAWKYVKECLDTEWVSTAGPFVGRFEQAMADFTGAPRAVAAVNGTAALHAALLALGVKPGDRVIVPSLTFIATANAVRYCGAIPVLADCDPVRFNLDLDALEAYLSKKGRPKIRAVVPAHILGYPLDMPRLMKLARKHGLLVVEDAAESLGSYWDGRHTGSFGHAGILSFNGNKVMTSGGGGMIVTSDAKLAARARHLTTQAKTSDFEYVHDQVGYNYRLTNIQAALGLSQAELLPQFLAHREKIAAWYRAELPGVPAAASANKARWNRWLLAVTVPDAKRRDALLAALNGAGCQSRPLWRPVHLQKPYADAPALPCPNAEHAYATTVNIPSSTCVTRGDVARVCAVLRRHPLTGLLA